MKHKTVYALCVSIMVLTGLVVVSLTLVSMEQQDTRLLRQQLAQLKQENTALKAQLRQFTHDRPLCKPDEAQRHPGY